MLKECQDKASKDTIPVIDYLKTITPKNSIDYKLLEDPLYLKHTISPSLAKGASSLEQQQTQNRT